MTTNLIERLKQAECGSRELDAEIAKLFDLPHGPSEDVDIDSRSIWYCEEIAAEFTDSLDASLALVAECGQLVRYISWHRFEGESEIVHATVGQSHFDSKVGRHKSPAIALLIALLTAKAEQETQ